MMEPDPAWTSHSYQKNPMETNIGENSNPENSFTESPGGIKKTSYSPAKFRNVTFL